jgi:cytidine deaminase
MEVVLAKSEDEYKVLTLKDVLPLAFTEVNL